MRKTVGICAAFLKIGPIKKLFMTILIMSDMLAGKFENSLKRSKFKQVYSIYLSLEYHIFLKKQVAKRSPLHPGSGRDCYDQIITSSFYFSLS